MRQRVIAATALAALALAWLMQSVYGQREARRVARRQAAQVANGQPLPIRKSSLPRPYLGARFLAAAQTPPRPWVTVLLGLNLDANTQTLYQQMATLLSGVTAVPNDRVNYDSAVINDIANWQASLSNVQSDGSGGHAVTLRVGPVIAEGKWFGSSGTMASDYTEIYHVDSKNNITYVGFTDPNGSAGQEPVFSLH